jgi:hypothetical protein
MTNPKHTDTSRIGDLVERLRGDKYTCRENMGCGTMEFCACATMEDAADRIEALVAKIERLRDLLVRGYVVCDGDDEDAVAFLNDVRAALGEKQ